ncbi:hypothetical protein AB0I39_07590 [Kitasatospora purpeofusca]|uniref:hypothetical protein n=1 Tax=Kitasatospora purpeofusca TaxID=67352 RepID=UPI0034015A62
MRAKHKPRSGATTVGEAVNDTGPRPTDTVTGWPCPTCSDTTTLTADEHAVLLYTAAGHGARQIADHSGRTENHVRRTLGTLRTALGAAGPEQVVDIACRLGLVPPTVPDLDLDAAGIGEPHLDIVTASTHGLTAAEAAEVLGLEEQGVLALRRALFSATGLVRMTAVIALLHALGRLPAGHPCPAPHCVVTNASAASTVRAGVAHWARQMSQQADTRLAYATAAHRLVAETARLATVTRELRIATALAENAREQAQAALGQARTVADVWTALAASRPQVAAVTRAAQDATRLADTADTRSRRILADLAQGEQLARQLGEQLADARLLWRDMGPAVKELALHRADTGARGSAPLPGPAAPGPPSGSDGRPPVPADRRPWRRS